MTNKTMGKEKECEHDSFQYTTEVFEPVGYDTIKLEIKCDFCGKKSWEYYSYSDTDNWE